MLGDKTNNMPKIIMSKKQTNKMLGDKINMFLLKNKMLGDKINTFLLKNKMLGDKNKMLGLLHLKIKNGTTKPMMKTIIKVMSGITKKLNLLPIMMIIMLLLGMKMKITKPQLQLTQDGIKTSNQ